MRYILSNRGRASFRRCRRFRFLLQRILLHVFVYGRRNRTCRRSRAAMMHILSGRPAAIYRGCQSARAWRDAVERDEPDRRKAALLQPRDAGTAAPDPDRKSDGEGKGG